MYRPSPRYSARRRAVRGADVPLASRASGLERRSRQAADRQARRTRPTATGRPCRRPASAVARNAPGRGVAPAAADRPGAASTSRSAGSGSCPQPARCGSGRPSAEYSGTERCRSAAASPAVRRARGPSYPPLSNHWPVHLSCLRARRRHDAAPPAVAPFASRSASRASRGSRCPPASCSS